MLEKSYNVSIRRMFDIDRESHSYFIEQLTNSPHLRSVLIKRFLKFVDKLKASEKTRKMFHLIKHDVRSVTGSNLRNIMTLVGKDSIESLNTFDADNITYADIEDENIWRVNLVQEITDIKFGEHYLDNFKRKELNIILRNICTT